MWYGHPTGPEDHQTSMTLRNVGVFTMDTRAKDGTHQFISVGLETEHTISRANYAGFWLWNISRDAIDGMGCCSKRWITTHYITFSQMHAVHTLRTWQCVVPTNVWPFLELPELAYTP